jgi:hypothetical protein
LSYLKWPWFSVRGQSLPDWTDAEGQNSNYSFRVKKSDQGAVELHDLAWIRPTTIEELFSAANFPGGRGKSLFCKRLSSLFPELCLYDVPLPVLMVIPGPSIRLDPSRHSDPSWKKLRVQIDRSNKSAAIDPRVLEHSLLVTVDDQWLVRQAEGSLYSKEGACHLSLKHDFQDVPQTSERRIVGRTLQVAFPNGSKTNESVKYEYDELRISSETPFTLSEFGLPEPQVPGAGGVSTWILMVTISIGLILLGQVFRFLSRRREKQP